VPGLQLIPTISFTPTPAANPNLRRKKNPFGVTPHLQRDRCLSASVKAEVYWQSPELLVLVDVEQFNGWQQLHDSYINGYSDRSAMGFIQPKRIQVKLLKPDFVLALTWWSAAFSSSKQEIVETAP
jgi:hypothetical protein